MTKKHKYHPRNLSVVNTLFLTLSPILTLVFTYFWLKHDGFDYRLFLMAAAFYIFSGLSITAGYHRLFAHKAYDGHGIVKFFLLVFGAAAFQNSALKWSSDHRIHHKDVDTEKDPYNINEGFFYAHMGWVMLKEKKEWKDTYVRDLTKDKLVMWQHKNYLLIATFFGVILPALCGWLFFDSLLGGIAIGVGLKIVLLHHCTFFINSLCHYVGSTPYTDSNTAKDSWYMAFLTFGEGYHNFHHFFQADYRNGVRWFHFDPTKWLIQVLAKCKLAYKLKRTPDFKIANAKLQMKLKQVKNSYGFDESLLNELEKIKERAVESLKRWEDIKKQYYEAKKKIPNFNAQEFREKIILAKKEFRKNIEAFNDVLQSGAQLAG